MQSIQVRSDQHWVEIGPGQGALTGPLLKTGVRLDIIELDRDLVSQLQKRYVQQQGLTLHSADALKFDFSALVSRQEKLHIVGNLPYNISTPLLFHLMNFSTLISTMYFMLQKEVVARICAVPGSKTYGRLSVMMQLYCTTDYLFDVSAESFEPVPKVTSAVVQLTPHLRSPAKIDSMADFNMIVSQAFSQRRKTIRNSLKKLLAEESIAALDIDPKKRAERLSLQDYAKISNSYTRSTANR